MRRPLCLIAVAMSVLPGSANAALVASDSFLQGPAAGRPLGQYATGNITSSNTTLLGFVSPGAYTGNTSNFTIDATAGAFQDAAPVTYDTDVTAGGTQRQVNWAGATDATVRNVSRALSPLPNSSEWWMSIMINRTTGSWGTVGNANINTYSSTVVGGFANSLDSNNGVAFGYSNGTGDGLPDLVLRSNYTTVTTLVPDAAANTIQFVIAKIDVNTAGLDTITIWVNPASVASVAALGTPVATITTQEVANSLTPFTHARFVSLGAAGSAKFDEIRLATEFASVVPEASSFAIFGAAAVLFAAARRFRRW